MISQFKTKKSLPLKIVSVILVLIMLISALPITTVFAAEKTQVNLKLGDELRYDPNINWTTHQMFVDGKMSYCINPKLPAPEGTFSTTANNLTELSPSNSNYKLIQKALYYCYGGNGFNKSVSVFTTSNHTYAGTTMSAFMGNIKEKYWLGASGSDLHYLLTHRILAYIFNDANWDYALSSDWKKAVKEITEAIKKAPNAPNLTKLFVLNPGNGKQKVVFAKDTIKLQLQKSSANTSITNGNSCYSLKGAKYNIYLDKNCTQYFGYITTNESGFGKYGSGDNGVDVPLQTYYAKEQTAPKGYALDKTVYEFKKSSKTVGGVPVYSFSCKDIPQNDPVRLLASKVDSSTRKGLEGAEFTIKYYDRYFDSINQLQDPSNPPKPTRTWIIKTDSDGYADLQSPDKYLQPGSDPLYFPQSGADPVIPLGTVTIQETKAPAGYFIDEDLFEVQQITSNNSSLDTVKTYNAPVVPNSLQGKINTKATGGDTGTNESYANYGTSTIIDRITYNDLIAGYEYKLIGVLMDKETGKELLINGKTVTSEKTFTAKDEKGSIDVEFTFDSESIAGKEVVVFETLYYNDTEIASHKDLNDAQQTITFKTPKITTSAVDKSTGINESYVSANTTIIDTVRFDGLIANNDYVLKATLMDKTGLPLFDKNGKPISGETAFIASNESGTADVEINFDSTEIAGKEVVVFETLYFNNKRIATHSDINDSKQTVKFKTPKLNTAASDRLCDMTMEFDNKCFAYTSTSTILNDYVIYSDIVGKSNMTYTVEGILMDKSTGEPLVVNGETVTATETFITDSDRTSGGFNLEYNFDSTGLGGKEVVIFERLYLDGKLIAEHCDLNDINQTVKFITPSIKTEAVDSYTKTNIGVAGTSNKITDTVHLTGLIEGESYTVQGKLIDKATTEEFLDENDEAIAASKTFTAADSEESINLEYSVDTAALDGKSLVVYENLIYKNEIIASHEDINDGKQTVTYKTPKITTKAFDKQSDCEYGYINESTNVVDTVSYFNLIPGLEYTVLGVVIDKSTGNQLLINNKPVMTEKAFTATSSNGTVDVEFKFNSSDLKDKSVVIFETLYLRGKEIAFHRDINDSNQTITFKDPQISTIAKDSKTGGHEAFINADTVVIDTVTCNGLIIGKEYRLVGTLMEADSRTPLYDNGKLVTAEKTFRAANIIQTEDIEFNFNSTALKNKAIVAFEVLYFDNTCIAVHQDYSDKLQTILFKEPAVGTTARDSFTGTNIGFISEKTTVIDTVRCTDLIVGEEYEIKGKIMDKATGRELLVDNEAVTTSKRFTAETENCTFDLDFTFDSTELKNKSIVVFESLYYKGTELALHNDINDTNQTVTFREPTIKTQAADTETNSNYAFTNEKTVVVDTVSYDGLLENVEYDLTGTLMDEETGEELLVDNKPVVVNTKFTPKGQNGSIDVNFEFNSSELTGKKIVIYEKLSLNDTVVAQHTDLTDKLQTISFSTPKISTTAKDTLTNDNTSFVRDETVIIDKVNYFNLIIGKEYEVKGKLMDKSTGRELLVENKPVTAEKKFTAETTDGFIELEFKFDSTALKGQSIVVFEDLYYNGKLVTTHSDLTDGNQTITFKNPEIHTTAVDKETGTHEAYTSDKTTIVDTVSYKGLVKGQKYNITGVLMDKETGKELLVDNKPVTASATFTAEKENGSVDVEFKLNSTKLNGVSVVAFETITLDKEIVAQHADINDSNQTVVFNVTPEKIDSTPNGDNISTGQAIAGTVILFGLLAISFICIVITYKKRNVTESRG